MYRCIVVLMLVAFVSANMMFAEDPPVIVWNKTFDTGTNDYGEDIAVDANGYAYVTGNTWSGGAWDWLTIKYDANGDTVWTRFYSTISGADDVASGIAADVRNVYVAGWTPDNAIHDWRILKYDTDGVILWDTIRDWEDVDQFAHSIAVDPTGFIYVTGEVYNGADWDYLTIKYNSDGDTIWERTWDSGVHEKAFAIAVDLSGSVYVSGNAENMASADWFTIKYDANGDTVWTRTYDSGTNDWIGVDALTVDNTGNVYVAGWSENATTDWQIIKYDASGNHVWDKTFDSGDDEGAWDVMTDTAGYLYINGDVYNSADWDYRTMKYDTDGDTMMWEVIFDSGFNDGGRGLAVDDSGYVYVTGYSENGTTTDYRTIKYQQQTGVAEYSPGDYFPLTLEVVNNPTSTLQLKYTLPVGRHGHLSFYYADGRKIAAFLLDSSHSTFLWDGGELPSGVYFVRLVCGYHAVSEKICLMK